MAIPKIKDSNGNLTKSVPFFANGTDGWFSFPTTLTYPVTYSDSSIDSVGTAYTITLTTGADVSASCELGWRFKYRVNNTVTYGILVAKTTNTITLFLKRGTVAPDNTKVIDNIYFSPAKCPVGFSVNPAHWSIILSDTASRILSNPTAGSVYNFNNFNISILTGIWKRSMQFNLTAVNASTAQHVLGVRASLSTTSNTLDSSFLVYAVSGYAIACLNQVTGSIYKEDNLELSTKTTYYLTAAVTAGTALGIVLSNEIEKMTLKATCAYL